MDILGSIYKNQIGYILRNHSLKLSETRNCPLNRKRRCFKNLIVDQPGLVWINGLFVKVPVV